LKNDKTYVGFTSQKVETRLKQHHIGTNKWTRENGPFILAYYENYSCKKDALSRETFYKSGFGRKIKSAILETLINTDKLQ